MRRKKCLPLALCVAAALWVWLAPAARAQEAASFEDELLEKSGASALYDGLDGETRELVEAAESESLFTVLSNLLREKLSGPLKALAALTAVIMLCRLADCFEPSGLGSVTAFAGALACAAVVAAPILEVMEAAGRAVKAASAFLLAAAPVYAALMTASGAPTAGASYGVLTLAAGNVIPILSSTVAFPLLRVFLALALVASVSELKLDKLAGSLYGFVKWLLVLTVTVFSGVLSVQTALNAQTDAAGSKAVKLVTASAVPIVGSAFGDAAAAILNSVSLVKSGAGAFGVLAAICIFAPIAVEAALWAGVCSAGQIMGDLFGMTRLSAFLKLCAAAAKMILAVIASTCIVSVVSAAVVIFAGGGG